MKLVIRFKPDNYQKISELWLPVQQAAERFSQQMDTVERLAREERTDFIRLKLEISLLPEYYAAFRKELDEFGVNAKHFQDINEPENSLFAQLTKGHW